MNNWEIFKENTEPHDGIENLPPPPSWRPFGHENKPGEGWMEVFKSSSSNPTYNINKRLHQPQVLPSQTVAMSKAPTARHFIYHT